MTTQQLQTMQTVVLDDTSVFERATVLAGVLLVEDFDLTASANKHTQTEYTSHDSR